MSDPLDNIPVKPQPRESRVIFQHGRYVASAMRDGSLIVQDTLRGTGKRLVGEQVPEWRDAIENAMDDEEAEYLCKHLLRN